MFGEFTQPFIIIIFTMIRLLAILRTVPFMGSTVMPPLLLTGFVFSLMPLLFPIVQSSAPADITFDITLVALMLKELFLGILLGFVFGLLFWIAQSVGYLIDNQRGASQSEGTDPLSGEQVSPFASLLFQAITMLFFTSGAFLVTLGIIFESYIFWKPFEIIPGIMGPEILNIMLGQASFYMKYTIMFAGPIMALCFLSDFCLGLINRFAQQLNVFVLSMPIKSAVALFVLILYAGALIKEFGAAFPGIEEMFTAIQSALR